MGRPGKNARLKNRNRGHHVDTSAENVPEASAATVSQMGASGVSVSPSLGADGEAQQTAFSLSHDSTGASTMAFRGGSPQFPVSSAPHAANATASPSANGSGSSTRDQGAQVHPMPHRVEADSYFKDFSLSRDGLRCLGSFVETVWTQRFWVPERAGTLGTQYPAHVKEPSNRFAMDEIMRFDGLFFFIRSWRQVRTNRWVWAMLTLLLWLCGPLLRQDAYVARGASPVLVELCLLFVWHLTLAPRSLHWTIAPGFWIRPPGSYTVVYQRDNPLNMGRSGLNNPNGARTFTQNGFVYPMPPPGYCTVPLSGLCLGYFSANNGFLYTPLHPLQVLEEEQYQPRFQPAPLAPLMPQLPKDHMKHLQPPPELCYLSPEWVTHINQFVTHTFANIDQSQPVLTSLPGPFPYYSVFSKWAFQTETMLITAFAFYCCSTRFLTLAVLMSHVVNTTLSSAPSYRFSALQCTALALYAVALGEKMFSTNTALHYFAGADSFVSRLFLSYGFGLACVTFLTLADVLTKPRVMLLVKMCSAGSWLSRFISSSRVVPSVVSRPLGWVTRAVAALAMDVVSYDACVMLALWYAVVMVERVYRFPLTAFFAFVSMIMMLTDELRFYGTRRLWEERILLLVSFFALQYGLMQSSVSDDTLRLVSSAMRATFIAAYIAAHHCGPHSMNGFSDETAKMVEDASGVLRPDYPLTQHPLKLRASQTRESMRSDRDFSAWYSMLAVGLVLMEYFYYPVDTYPYKYIPTEDRPQDSSYWHLPTLGAVETRVAVSFISRTVERAVYSRFVLCLPITFFLPFFVSLFWHGVLLRSDGLFDALTQGDLLSVLLFQVEDLISFFGFFSDAGQTDTATNVARRPSTGTSGFTASHRPRIPAVIPLWRIWGAVWSTINPFVMAAKIRRTEEAAPKRAETAGESGHLGVQTQSPVSVTSDGMETATKPSDDPVQSTSSACEEEASGTLHPNPVDLDTRKEQTWNVTPPPVNADEGSAPGAPMVNPDGEAYQSTSSTPSHDTSAEQAESSNAVSETPATAVAEQKLAPGRRTELANGGALPEKNGATHTEVPLVVEEGAQDAEVQQQRSHEEAPAEQQEDKGADVDDGGVEHESKEEQPEGPDEEQEIQEAEQEEEVEEEEPMSAAATTTSTFASTTSRTHSDAPPLKQKGKPQPQQQQATIKSTKKKKNKEAPFISVEETLKKKQKNKDKAPGAVAANASQHVQPPAPLALAHSRTTVRAPAVTQNPSHVPVVRVNTDALAAAATKHPAPTTGASSLSYAAVAVGARTNSTHEATDESRGEASLPPGRDREQGAPRRLSASASCSTEVTGPKGSKGSSTGSLVPKPRSAQMSEKMQAQTRSVSSLDGDNSATSSVRYDQATRPTGGGNTRTSPPSGNVASPPSDRPERAEPSSTIQDGVRAAATAAADALRGFFAPTTVPEAAHDGSDAEGSAPLSQGSRSPVTFDSLDDPNHFLDLTSLLQRLALDEDESANASEAATPRFALGTDGYASFLPMNATSEMASVNAVEAPLAFGLPGADRNALTSAAPSIFSTAPVVVTDPSRRRERVSEAAATHGTSASPWVVHGSEDASTVANEASVDANNDDAFPGEGEAEEPARRRRRGGRRVRAAREAAAASSQSGSSATVYSGRGASDFPLSQTGAPVDGRVGSSATRAASAMTGQAAPVSGRRVSSSTTSTPTTAPHRLGTGEVTGVHGTLPPLRFQRTPSSPHAPSPTSTPPTHHPIHSANAPVQVVMSPGGTAPYIVDPSSLTGHPAPMPAGPVMGAQLSGQTPYIMTPYGPTAAVLATGPNGELGYIIPANSFPNGFSGQMAVQGAHSAAGLPPQPHSNPASAPVVQLQPPPQGPIKIQIGHPGQGPPPASNLAGPPPSPPKVSVGVPPSRPLPKSMGGAHSGRPRQELSPSTGAAPVGVAVPSGAIGGATTDPGGQPQMLLVRLVDGQFRAVPSYALQSVEVHPGTGAPGPSQPFQR